MSLSLLSPRGSVPLYPRRVHSQVVGEPAVPGPEGLRLGGLRVPHDAEPVAERLEVHDPVVPDPELLPAAGEVQVLGREQVEDVPDQVAGAGSCACRGRRGSASRRSASCRGCAV